MRHLESSFNPEAAEMVESFEQGKEILLDQANIALFKIREKWRKAINQ